MMATVAGVPAAAQASVVTPARVVVALGRRRWPQVRRERARRCGGRDARGRGRTEPRRP